MAVAVRSPEAPTASAFDRLPVVCLASVIYILGCLGIIFKLLPYYLLPPLSALGDSAGNVVLGLIMLVAATLLVIVGARLMGAIPPQAPGLASSCCALGVLLVLFDHSVGQLWIDHLVYRDHMFGNNGPLVGACLTAAVGLGLLGYGIFLLFKKSTEKLLIAFEAQGWFSATAYKRQQGQKVRRGTILGILLLAGAGIYTLHAHGTLEKGRPNWELNVPFTGLVIVENPGDVGPHLQGLGTTEITEGKKTVAYPYVSRYTLRDINDRWANPKEFVKVADAGKCEALRGKEGVLMPKATFDEDVQKMRDEFDREMADVKDPNKLEAERKAFESGLPKAVAPEPASGPVQYSALTLLPGVQFTVPLLLAAASLWLAWRAVNLPIFADFLIATEAELNKVSWTTRKRLFQDTIVVLAAVLLMAGFLFVVDQTWRIILSWPPIGVLKFSENQGAASKEFEERPW